MDRRRFVRALLVTGLAAGGAAAAIGVWSMDERAAGSEWSYAAPMSQRRSYAAVAELGGRIYVAGGMVGETGRHLATFQRFDPRTDSWETLPPLPVAIRAGAAAAAGGRIYVIGGDTSAGGGRQVYTYDANRRRWQPRAPLPAARQNHAAVALEGQIYVLGGLDAEARERAEVFAYDPADDRWRAAPLLPQRLHALAAVVIAGRIWAIGGRSDGRPQTTIWTLSTGARTWESGPTLPQPMELLGAATSDDAIHMLTEHTYHVFDLRMQSWQEGPTPNVPRHALALISVDNALYALGGCTSALEDSQIVERRLMG